MDLGRWICSPRQVRFESLESLITEELSQDLRDMPYEDFLTTSYWRAVADHVKQRDGWKCTRCGSSHELQVHHASYKHHGREHQHTGDLITLCKPCHNGEHGDPQSRPLSDVIAEYMESRKQGEDNDGIPTGFVDVDRLFGGWRPGELTVLAGRPSVGKSALAMTFACKAASDGNRVLVVSREMGQNELAERMLSSHSDVNSVKLRKGSYDEHEKTMIEWAAEHLRPFPMLIAGPQVKTFAEVRSEAKRHKADFIVVDYLGLMRTREGNNLYEKSREAKELTLDLGVPVLLLCQLNREIEKQQRRPRMSDLRDSGAIEQDANNIMFLHREEDDDNPLSEVELIVEKQRNGPRGWAARLQWNKGLVRFENLAHTWTTEPQEGEF